MKYIILLLSIVVSLSGVAQVHQPVKWHTSISSIDSDSATLLFNADIETGWHIYSQRQAIENGPIPTQFVFQHSGNYTLVGNTEEGTPSRHPEPAYDNQVLSYFSGKASFAQKIALETIGMLNTYNVSP